MAPAAMTRLLAIEESAQRRLRRISARVDEARREYSFEHDYRVPLTRSQVVEHVQRETGR